MILFTSQAYKPAYAKATISLAPAQIELVRTNLIQIIAGDTTSFKKQTEHNDPLVFLAVTFYDRLFQIAPEVRPLFKRPITEQGSMLAKMIGLAVQLLDDLTTLVPTLERLAARHVRYGAQISHYGPVGASSSSVCQLWHCLSTLPLKTLP
jgi:Globin